MAKTASLKSFIENLYSKNTDYKYPEQAINQAESLKSLSNDLYTDNIRFIYELIQNADDAEANEVLIGILGKRYLFIAHNGKVFNEKDLQGLCGINNGTKRKDLEKTGYKGLGFKAVFGKSDYVLIYSHGEYFRFDSSYQIPWNKQWGTNDQQSWEKQNDRQFIYPWQINPIWTNEKQLPDGIHQLTHSVKDLYDVAYIIVLNDVEEIHLAIDQLKEQLYVFLFLRNINKMRFLAKPIDIVLIDRDSNYGLKKVYFNETIVSQWLIKRLELNVPEEIRKKLAKDTKAPEKLRSIEKAEIFFAAKYNDSIGDEDLDDINANGIKKLCDHESLLFSYLPTKISEYQFPVLVNTNFLTNANREQLNTDSPWNQWLFSQTAIEIFQWIKNLVIDEKFHFQAYRLIPSKISLTNNHLSKQFNQSFDEMIKDCDFILNREKQLLRVDQVIMDLTSLSEQTSFVDISVMRQFFINNNKRNHLGYDQRPFIDHDSNLAQIGVQQFTWNDAIEMFKSDLFNQKHSIERNKQMIQFFYSRQSNAELNENKNFNIEKIPFLIDQNNRLQLIKNIYFPIPTINENKIIDSNVSYIHKKLFDWLNESKQAEIRQWLQTLGVAERTDVSYLYKTIMPYVSTYITLKNAIRTIKWLFMLFQKNSIGKNELNQLKQLRLLTTCNTLVAAEQCYFSDEYKPRLSIEEYLKIKEKKFLSSNYIKTENEGNEKENLLEWQRFFILMGVHEDIYVVHFTEKLTIHQAIAHGFHREYLSKTLPNGRRKMKAYSGLKTISFLQHTEGNNDFAKQFWSFTIQHLDPLSLKQSTRGYVRANNGTVISDIDYVKWFINHIECLPTTMNKCQLSTNIFFNTNELRDLWGKYMPFIDIPLIEKHPEWQQFFNFKTNFSLNDYYSLLDKIRQDGNNLEGNQQFIQNIYFHLMNNMDSWSSQERKSIEAELKPIHLLAGNNKWELSDTLHFYVENNDNYIQFSNTIRYLKLDFKNRKHPKLNRFLQLFNVKQITNNDLNFLNKKSSRAEQFHLKLMQISPFIKNWLTKLSFPADSIESIDQIIEKQIDFIESDHLELSYNEKVVQKLKVHYNNTRKQFYITRPWSSETTMMELPNKLCQLLNIQGFEDQIRLLLKGTMKEIKNYFQEYSIDIPIEREITTLKPVINQDSTQSSDEPATTVSQQKPISQLIPSYHRQLDHIQLIDISSLFNSKSITLETGSARTLEHNHFNLLNNHIGERLVYAYLQTKYPAHSNSTSINWENRDRQSSLPYDIVLNVNGKEHFIKVQTSPSNDDYSFPWSTKQIYALLKYNEMYFIYHVYLKEKMLAIFDNIQWHLTNPEHLACFLTIKRLPLNQ